MIRSFALTLALTLAASLAAPAVTFAASDIGIADFEITDPGDLALVLAIDDAVSVATTSIGGCREAGGELTDCLCANLADIDSIRDALETALAVHPEWTDKALFVADIGNGQSMTIWLDTAARMVEPPDCN
jgi:hypothetical protein